MRMAPLIDRLRAEVQRTLDDRAQWFFDRDDDAVSEDDWNELWFGWDWESSEIYEGFSGQITGLERAILIAQELAGVPA